MSTPTGRTDATTSVIVAGARTPMGRLLGSLKDFSGADLGGVAIKGALERAGVSGDQVDYVIMGQVLTAGAGQIPARQAAAKAGIPMTVPALTINKVCLSGIDAIALADQLIRAGEFEIVVAGGQESMTNAPHLLAKSREGFKYGDVAMRDHMAFDGLWDAFTDQAMGLLTEAANAGDAAVHPRGAGRVLRPQPPARRQGLEGRAVRRRGRPRRDPAAQGRAAGVPHRRGHPRRHHDREPRPAATRVQQGRHHHGRVGVADLRRRGRGRGDEQGQGRGAGPDLAGRDRRARRRRRPGLHAAEPAGRAPSRRPARRRASRPPTSTWSRSTRRSRRSAWPRPRSSASTRTRSTSTAAPSPWVTRSACPAPGSPCTWRWSCKRRGGGVGAAALCGGGGQGDALIVRVSRGPEPARRHSDPWRDGPSTSLPSSRRRGQDRHGPSRA